MALITYSPRGCLKKKGPMAKGQRITIHDRAGGHTLRFSPPHGLSFRCPEQLVCLQYYIKHPAYIYTRQSPNLRALQLNCFNLKTS